ncbi:MAG TPA: tetratricopeptide repeat protein [Terracidiphilus sp.]|nr:tetratricopeptide repeat protein [Terracidiphilus sp.]
MRGTLPPTGSIAQSGASLRARTAAALALAALSLLTCPASAQSTRRPDANETALQESHAGGGELESRAIAAQNARSSGDPSGVIAANRLVVAAAMRELGDLKLVQSDYAGSVKLYSDSLEYEDVAATYVSLGFAELQAGQFDQAIEHGKQAHAADPNDLRADRLLATALDQKGAYAEAVEPFTRIAKAQPTVDNLYPLAECLLQTRKPADRQQAVRVFEQMKQIAGDSGSLHVLMGRAYRDGGDINAAMAEFRRAIEIDPRTPHAHYFLGLAQLFANDWKPTPAIEEEIRKEAQIYPDDYLANYMLGVTTAGERKYDESDKYLEAAARIDPQSPDPYLYLGMNAYAEEKMDRAEAMMRKAIETTGSDEARTNYQIRRAYVDMARILGQSGRMEESKIYAAKARELENKIMVATQVEVSRMVSEHGGQSEAAVVPLSKEQESQSAQAVQDKDRHRSLTSGELSAVQAREKAVRSIVALAFNDMATAEAIQKRFNEALGDYLQAQHWDSTLGGLQKNLGLCAFRLKNYEQASSALSEAVAQGENSDGVHAMLGLSYFALGKYQEAVHAFEPLGERGMKDAEVGYAWAASLAHAGDLKNAGKILSAFESEPLPNDALLLAGQLWTEIGDFTRANAVLDRALAADPALPKAHFYKGLVYIRSEKWPEAAREFEAELSLNPGDTEAMYHLGFVDQQQSRTDDALALYLKVIATNPQYANAQYEAGKIYFDRGQYPVAAQHLESAAKLTPDKDYIHYQLQSVYRKLGRTADADRELEVYKEMKAQSRQRIADKLKSQ